MEVLLAACCVGALNPSLLWRDDYFDQAYDIITDGNTAYVAAGASGVLVVDVTNPASPTLLGVCYTRGEARSVQLSGTYVYVADYDRGLAVCDVSSPSTPILTKTWDCPAAKPCRNIDVDVDGSTVYLGDMGNGVVYLLDTVDLTVKGNFSSSGAVHGLDVVREYLYVAAGYGGLEVVGVGDAAASPNLVGVGGNVSALRVLVAGDVAYVSVAVFPTELQIFDVTDPSSPSAIGSVYVGHTPDGLALQGGTTLYTACNAVGLDIVDVTDPENPTVTTTLDIPSTGVAFTGSTVFTVWGGTPLLTTVDASVQKSPLELATYGGYGKSSAVYIQDDVAVIADVENNEIRVYDVATPSAATLLSSLNYTVDPYGVFVLGEYVYVGTATGFNIVDITNPSALSQEGSVDLPDAVYSVWVVGQHAYVCAFTAGLLIFDVSDPTTPIKVASYDTGYAFDVTVVGTTAYVAAWFNGLTILNVASPTAPTLLGAYDTPGEARGLAVAGNIAYVADHGGGLQIVDVKDPTAPTLLGSYPLGDARAVSVVGEVAYVADWRVGVQMLDVSDPTAPILAGTVPAGIIEDVHAVGTTVYMADGGLRIVDITVSNDCTSELCGAGQTCSDAASGAVCTCGSDGKTNIGGPVVPCQTSDDDDEGVPFWVWILVVLGVLGLCGGAAVYYMKRKPGATFQSLEEGLVDDSHELQNVKDDTL